MIPKLYIVVPCYNEQEVLPITSKLFLEELEKLAQYGKIAEDSRILFVDDGSKDATWQIICDLAKEDKRFCGIKQSRNRGHQNALVAGLFEVKDKADIVITADCDGQDDISAMEKMVDEYLGGAEIVYGVRKSRENDSAFKRTTAQSYYKILESFGVEVVYNHADYRLTSAKVLAAFAEFGEVNLYLRGMFPLVGFKSTVVEYDRSERLAGKTHYPLGKMLGLAVDGITSLSIRPIRMITAAGLISAALSFIGILWSIIARIIGITVSGWASMVCFICFFGGLILLSLGIIGEYIGKIYMEVKHRPRFIISERTEDK